MSEKKIVTQGIEEMVKEMQDKIAELEKRAVEAERRAEEIAQAKANVEEEPKNALELLSKEQRAFIEEKVPVQLIKDNNKYKFDVTVVWNGKNYQIQRGKVVNVPRGVALILEQSYRQQIVAMELQEKLQNQFEDKRKQLE